MPLELPAVVLLATAPLWVVAASTGARRLAEQRRSLDDALRQRRQAVDEVRVALAWAVDVEIDDGETDGLLARGRADGQRFELRLREAGWRMSVELQPLLPNGVAIRSVEGAGRALPAAEGDGKLGHRAFDRHYVVTPRAAGGRLPPALIELLGRRPIAGLDLAGTRLSVDAPTRVSAGGAGRLVARLREILALARALEGAVGHRLMLAPAGSR